MPVTHRIAVIEGGKSNLAIDGLQPAFAKGTTAAIEPDLVDIKDVEQVVERQPDSVGGLVSPALNWRIPLTPGLNQLQTGEAIRIKPEGAGLGFQP